MTFRSSRVGGGWIAFIALLILLGIGLLVLLWQWESIVSSLCAPALEQQTADREKPIETMISEAQQEAHEEEALTEETAEEEAEEEGEEEEASAVSETSEASEDELKWLEVTGTLPTWPSDFDSPKDCLAVREDLLTLCRALDSRPYMKARAFSGGTFELVEELCETLTNHPPVASGEILRYESFTANVFHLFRALGKNRTYMLIEIVAREQDLAEPMAMALFRWLLANEKCAPEESYIGFKGLHDYAAYFLNTIGGQAYIHRRTPKIAVLTSFYALVILDLAIQKDINPHGVDPRPLIRSCVELMELQDLVFKDQYMQILEEMAQRWESY